jgi:excisionase family DNA binding protein
MEELMSVAEETDDRRTRGGEAKEALDALLRDRPEEALEMVIRLRDDENPVLELPRRALEALREVLDVLEDGEDVEVVPKERELSTSEAADVLNVSRPHLVDLLEDGEIPFHRVGSHRRVRLADLMEYKREQKQQSRERMRALADEDEKLDVDY